MAYTKRTRIYNFRAWIKETESHRLKADFDNLLKEAGYGIVGFNEHHFSPQGYTAIWLLSESHLAVHTFPEEGKCYVELSGCSSTMNEAFKKSLFNQFTVLNTEEEAVS